MLGSAVAAPPATARDGRAWPLDRLTAVGMIAAVALLFAVSGGMLWLIGYNYEGLTGSPVTKIHPFTYLIGLLVVWRMAASGNPVSVAVHLVERRPAALLLAFAGLLLLVATVLRRGPGMAGFVDTFVGPALLAILLADADARALRRLTVLLHLLMTANALLALYEFAAHTLVFPYRLDGAVFPTDLRSSSLQGHPLVNASLTACYILALMSGARSLPHALRLALIALQGAALVTFGGRSGMVVTLLLGGAYVVTLALGSLRGRRVPLLGAAMAIVVLTLVPVGLGAVGAAGFFDALLERFGSDGGSANARVQMLELFKAIPLRDLLVGPDTGLVDSVRRINGLEWGIENPILRLVLYQGAFLTLLLTIAFGLFMAEVARGCARGVWLPMLGCLILLNTAESLGAKTTLLAKIVVLMVCLYREAPPRRRDGRVSSRAS